MALNKSSLIIKFKIKIKSSPKKDSGLKSLLLVNYLTGD